MIPATILVGIADIVTMGKTLTMAIVTVLIISIRTRIAATTDFVAFVARAALAFRPDQPAIMQIARRPSALSISGAQQINVDNIYILGAPGNDTVDPEGTPHRYR